MVHPCDEYYPSSCINFSGDYVNNQQYEKECVASACSATCGKGDPCKASATIMISAYGRSEVAAINETIKRLEHEINELQSRRREVINRYSLNKTGILRGC
jgi:hypothetical protein